MLQVFTEFGKMLDRPKVKAMISSYQSTLLNSISKDIEKLKNKFFSQEKKGHELNKTRDMPDIVDKIVWMNNLTHKLKFYVEKISIILGGSWETSPEGMELKSKCDQVNKRVH